jgi:uncharacterized repeat protein (TIGR01451 family)
MNRKLFRRTVTNLVLYMLILCSVGYTAENIDPDNNDSQYAWGENVGWINFEPSGSTGIEVSSSVLSGYAWGENIGWISLSPSTGGVINDGAGNLSGYAWGENVGWINFAPAGGGVFINPTTGEFSGYAWGENVGWINFAPNGKPVKTSWRGVADLYIQKIDNPDPVQTGSQLKYTISVTNNGPGSATEIVLTDTLPDSLIYVSNSSGCTSLGNLVTCNLPDLSANDSVNIEIVTTVKCSLGDGSSIVNTGSVTSAVPDPDLSNNTNTATTLAHNPSPVITCPADIITSNDPGLCSTVINYSLPEVTDNCLGTTVSCSPPSGSTFPRGITPVNCTATDSGGATASCTFSVTVNDTEPPAVSNPSASPIMLWPPNHTMREVIVNYTATDNCPGLNCVISVTSSEPINGTGDGDTSPDWEIVDANHIRLRAERAGTGSGRVYTITVTCTDTSGNSTIKTATVVVAHNITAPKSGTAFKINTPVNLAGEFWDMPDKMHTAEWVIGSLTTSGIITEPKGLTNGTVKGTYTFSTPGVYKITMRVTDNTGVTTSVSTAGELEAIVVIYDPKGGYTIGGGWVPVPAGSYSAESALSGKLSFGFNSQYIKATNPKGAVLVRFAVGNFEFSSLNYDYLAISGSKAQLRGFGQVNGDAGYNFILTVMDGNSNGGVDKFRIKIWKKTTGAIVFDNQMGASDEADPTTPIGDGSSIVIQK